MGANAQTTVPTFTASQVLTSDQMNQSARTGVPVFADTTARDAAFGGSGEKTLAEGQLCYLESTNVVQYYDGAAWATVGPQTLSSGLNYITGATFTTATSVSLPDNTFSSTYRNYRMIFELTALTTDITLTGRFRASGSDITTSRYFQGSSGLSSDGTGADQADSVTSSWTFGGASSTTALWFLSVDVLAPQVATQSGALLGSHAFYPGSGGLRGRAFAGMYNPSGGGTFQADSFTLISNTASSMTGRYRVYGYADS